MTNWRPKLSLTVAAAAIAFFGQAQPSFAFSDDDEKADDFLTFRPLDTAERQTNGSDGSLIKLKSQIGHMTNILADGTSSQIGLVAPAVNGPGLGADHLGIVRQLGGSDGANSAPSSLLLNDTLDIGSFTPRYAGVQLDFGGDGSSNSGFGASLTTTYFVGGFDAGGSAMIDLSALNGSSRAYNFGLNLGYDGFRVGASYLRGESDLDQNVTGFDIGLMYTGQSWATSLQVSEFTQRRTLLNFGAQSADRVKSLEFGASYRLGLGVTLAGRFQYYDFGSRFLKDSPSDAQVLFLGTNLNF